MISNMQGNGNVGRIPNHLCGDQNPQTYFPRSPRFDLVTLGNRGLVAVPSEGRTLAINAADLHSKIAKPSMQDLATDLSRFVEENFATTRSFISETVVTLRESDSQLLPNQRVGFLLDQRNAFTIAAEGLGLGQISFKLTDGTDFGSAVSTLRYMAFLDAQSFIFGKYKESCGLIKQLAEHIHTVSQRVIGGAEFYVVIDINEMMHSGGETECELVAKMLAVELNKITRQHYLDSFTSAVKRYGAPTTAIASAAAFAHLVSSDGNIGLSAAAGSITALTSMVSGFQFVRYFQNRGTTNKPMILPPKKLTAQVTLSDSKDSVGPHTYLVNKRGLFYGARAQ